MNTGMTIGRLLLGCALAGAMGCGPLFGQGNNNGNTTDPGTGTSKSPVTSWPTFSGDCDAPWNHTVKAMNSNSVGDGSVQFNLSDTVDGVQGFQAYFMLTFDGADIGVPLSLDQSAAKHIKVNYEVINTTYQPYGDPGQIRGTVTVKKYEPPNLAEFTFDGATLIGHDSVYSGTYRCGISGTLSTSFGVTSLGTRCQTDLECGGARSGRICDDGTFVCASGCHVDEDCAVGHSCNTSSSICR
jgi:hypothetical protein